MHGPLNVKERHFTCAPLCVTLSSIRVLNFCCAPKGLGPSTKH